MVSFRQMRSRFKVDGFHCHHLIPRQVADHRHFAAMFGSLKAAGLNLDNFAENGTHLPYSEHFAEIFKLPLHRGGHPHYNSMVSAHIAKLIHLPIYDALSEVRMLQFNLRMGLRWSGSIVKTVPRHPMSTELATDMEILGLLADRRAKIVRIL